MNVAGYGLGMTFDPTALSDVSIVNGDYLPPGASILPVSTDPTIEGVAGFAADATAIGATSDGDGTLATVTFTVVEAKTSAIWLYVAYS